VAQYVQVATEIGQLGLTGDEDNQARTDFKLATRRDKIWSRLRVYRNSCSPSRGDLTSALSDPFNGFMFARQLDIAAPV
jgi:hypothetical protein